MLPVSSKGDSLCFEALDLFLATFLRKPNSIYLKHDWETTVNPLMYPHIVRLHTFLFVQLVSASLPYDVLVPARENQ